MLSTLNKHLTGVIDTSREVENFITFDKFHAYFKKKNMPAELCSTGEQKSLLISIILAQAKCQTLHKGFAPVLLLDEITAHLDTTKRDALLKKIVEMNLQAWITTTNPEQFNIIKNKSQFLEVKHNSATVV